METFGTTEGVRFCSEPCFSQSRRATFKRAKTCDWCRHVRHAVSYVDFQDGASQLQFCSDKCLNQYKMQIFIKETQAHLEMNPHLMDKGEGSGGSLITPELWLKNCRSRSASPEQQHRSRSVSPSPVDQEPNVSRRSDLEVTLPSSVINRPTITMAPVSKLLQSAPIATSQSSSLIHSTSTAAELMSNRPSMKTMRKRRTLRNGPPVRDTQSQLSYRHEETHTQNQSQNPYHPQQIPQTSLGGNKIQMPMNAQEGQSRFDGKQPIHQSPFDARFLSPPPNRHNLIPPSVSPHMFRSPVSEHSPLPPLPNLRPASMHHQQFYPGQFMMGANQVPPVTVLVPCPIILPIPVPIPIPINIPEFLLKLLAATAASKAGERDSQPEAESSASPHGGRSAPESDLNNNNTRSASSSNTGGINYSMHHRRSVDRVSNVQEESDSRRDMEQRDRHESDSEGSDHESSSFRSSCEVVPKIKITRLQSKRILSSRELDSTRPLRKRKRIVVDAYT